MLGSARAPEFQTPEGRDRALRGLGQHRVDGVVVIGGNGSLAGAQALAGTGFPVVGVASTIDNDVNGADITIGVDTALNIALEAIDRLKTTASSHQRAFLVEVMGRNRKSTRLNSSHGYISYAVFCLKKKKTIMTQIEKLSIASPAPSDTARQRRR